MSNEFQPSIFVASPLMDGSCNYLYVAGALQAMTHFAGRVAFEVDLHSSLPRSRDTLTARFLDSSASHMLCIDSDVGWTPADAQALLDTGLDFVSGTYCKKQPDRAIPAKLIDDGPGPVREAEYVPGGFLLVSRAAVERMVGAYRHLAYTTERGTIWALWAEIFERGETYSGEDVSFCRRWRAIGGKVWLHTGVVLKHVGDQVFLPGPEMKFA